MVRKTNFILFYVISIVGSESSRHMFLKNKSYNNDK